MATTINAGRVAMVPKGEWDASTAYVRLDVVSYHGSSYVCKQDGTGQTPDTATNYWQLLSNGLDPTVDTISAKHYDGSTVTAETSISASGVISKTASGVTKTYNLPSDSGTLVIKEETQLRVRPATDGMGYKILDPSATFASQVTAANTIYVVQNDFELSSDFTMPSNCILRFDGGSITGVGNDVTIDGLTDVSCDTSDRIFNNVYFTNTKVTLKLDWLVANKHLTMVQTSAADATDELEYAFNCGVQRIDLTSIYYFYITDTVNITANNLDLVGDTNFFFPAGSRTGEYLPPCIHTMNAITMIDFQVNVPTGQNRKALTIKGLKLWNGYTNTSSTYNDLTSLLSLPLLLIKNGNAGVHKAYIDVLICGADANYKHIINDDGDYAMWYDVLFTGIEFRTLNSQVMTYLNVDGIMTQLYCGVKAGVVTGGSWITDLTINCDTTGLAQICSTTVAPVTIGGSHQPMMRWQANELETHGFVDITSNESTPSKTVKVTGKLWDFGATQDVDVYNSNDESTGTTIVRSNPKYAVIGNDVIRYEQGLSYQARGYTDQIFDFDMRYSPELQLITKMAQGYNMLWTRDLYNLPNKDSGLFASVYAAGMSAYYKNINRTLVENVSITDTSDNSYTAEQVFSHGIDSLFMPRNTYFEVDKANSKNVSGNPYVLDSSHKFIVSFDIKYNLNNSSSSANINAFLLAYLDGWNQSKFTLVYRDGSTDERISKAYYPSDIIAIRLGDKINLSHVHVELHQSSKSLYYVPWIGLIGDSLNNCVNKDGGEVQGALTMGKGVIAMGNDTFQYLPNASFKDVVVSSDSYVEILTFSLYTGATNKPIKIVYDGDDCSASISMQWNYLSTNAPGSHSVTATNVGIKCEVYKGTTNANTRTIKVYAKRLGGNTVTLLARSILTNFAIFFEDLVDANTSVYATYEAGNLTRGATADRPTLTSDDAGFTYWDTTEGKMIAWSGTAWVEQQNKTNVVNTTDATVTLSADVIYDLGTVSGNKTINLPTTVDAGAEYEFRLAYTSGTISGTAISATTVANDATLAFTAGKTYQVIISGGILYYSETTVS